MSYDEHLISMAGGDGEASEADILDAAAERLAGDGTDTFWDAVRADLLAQYGILDHNLNGVLDGIELAAGALRTRAQELRSAS